ncbi:hypothetical protein N7516_003893 [Penicillium verrucosum]|uniref:uncharacterized protein n=1 Tax=Penicillium verrucosum TaxID=60171 RepID=UPI0025458AED|nr:uncharacterized protein N7516_003893 [Penicillium verrucosum]KAJ5943725.1 hypothetical protein N7516_003893 [Penicillium verrucosum]
MILQAVLAFATLGLAADYPVVSLFIPNADPQSLLGEVLAAQSATTTYSINCPHGKTNSTECGMGPGLFLTAAPTTVEYLITAESDNLYNHVVCEVTDLPTGAYTCTDTVTGQGAATPGTSTSTIAWDELSLLPVTITSTADAVAATANGPTATSTTEASPGSDASPAAATAVTTPAAGVAAATGATTGVSGVAERLTSTGLLLSCVAVQALAALM